MDKMRITLILIITCLIIIGTTCFAATGIVNAPNGLVLRKSASSSSDPITTVSDDESVEILEELENWYRVKYGNYEGYMYAEYVKKKAEPTETAAPAQTESVQEQTQAQENVQPTTVSIVYPTETTLRIAALGHMIPSITSKATIVIEQGSKVTVNYVVNNWANITYEGKVYWIRKVATNLNFNPNAEFVDNTNQEQKVQENTAVQTENKKGYIDVSSAANIRESASTSANIVTTLLRNTQVTILGEEGEFYKIQYQNTIGYVSKSLVSDKEVEVTSRSNTGERRVEVATTTQENSTTVQEEPKVEQTQEVATSVPAAPTSGGGAAVASYAQNYIGYNYSYGGTKPSTGFDCTGFAYYIYNECGYSLSRSCSVQSQSGTEVSREELQPGDLLLFDNGSNGSIGHVGIYVGGGNFVHAENNRTGVVTSTINDGYYNKYYYSARRIVE